MRKKNQKSNLKTQKSVLGASRMDDKSKLKISNICCSVVQTFSRSVKIKKGFTLIELLITSVILITMILLVNQIYIMGVIQSQSDLKKTRLQSEGKSSLGAITKNIKLAASAESVYGSYTSGSTTLILKIPAIDSSESFIYTAGVRDYDYVIYYLTDNTGNTSKSLHKVIVSIIPNSRLYSQNGSDSVVLSDIKTLTFSYDQVPPDSKVVTAGFTLEDKTQKNPIEVDFSEQGRLRND